MSYFYGRFQPFHNGHKQIVDKMKNPIVVLVKGKKSVEDVKRNPLDTDYQIKLFKKVFPNVPISVSPNGFLPGILGFFRKQGKEISTIYAGADRIASYEKAIEDANKKMTPDTRYHVVFKETERVTSASTVRDAIKNDDFEKFKQLVPKVLWDEWDELKTKLSKSLSEIKFITLATDLLDFENWLIETEIANTTTNLADASDASKIKTVIKRKKRLEK